MGNIIDKTIGYFSPELALKRAVARSHLDVINHGYSRHGASSQKNSLRGWNTSNQSVVEEVEFNINKLRERSKDLYMGGGVATGAIKTMRTNVIGVGLRLKPSIDYKYLGMSAEEATDFQEKVKREFDLWADSALCDVQIMNNFYELQQLAFKSWLTDGDCFAVLPSIKRNGMPIDLRIKLIEADRVSNPNSNLYSNNLLSDYKIVNGVEMNDLGEIIAYHICNVHPNSNITNKKWTRILKYGENSARLNVIHLMDSEWIDQRRGIPFLTPIIEQLKQIARYSEAELMSAVINSMYTVFITSKNQELLDELGDTYEGDLETDYESSNQNIELGNGSVLRLDPGDEIKEANPNRPFSGFEGFVNAISKQMSSALEIPVELLYKNFTSSYSASRGALLEAWKMFKMRRSWMASDFCQPIYEEFLSEAVAKGRINAPFFFSDPLVKKAYCKAEWIGPSQGMLNPVQETTAAILRSDNGLSSLTRETMELGTGDFESNHQNLVVEMEKRKSAGLINLKATIKANAEKGGENNDEDID